MIYLLFQVYMKGSNSPQFCVERSPIPEGGRPDERISPPTEDFRTVMAKRKVRSLKFVASGDNWSIIK